MYGVIMYEEE